MDLTQQSIHDVIHPTAAFADLKLDQAQPSQGSGEATWNESPLNPKNRIDSLEVPINPFWRIDGCTAFGSQFYAVPLFMGPVPPHRLDVFVPEPASLPSRLREILDTHVLFHTRDASRIAHLGLTRHVLQILQFWTLGLGDPRRIYQGVPFGSRIVIGDLPIDPSRAQVLVAPTHYLERQLFSVPALQELWGPSIQLPPTVDIKELTYISQPHDSVSVVEYEGRAWIFKGLTSYTRWMYHELRQLLRIEPHPNIISRPAFLVSKRCGFGGKVGILGFATEYHHHGSLRDLVPFLRLHDMASLTDETRWGLQLAAALKHLRGTSGVYYPDLRLDNIVLSESRDAIMIDFEQRGVWAEFAAPEVNSFDYIRLLAIDNEIPEQVRSKYAEILSDALPDWEKLSNGEEYTNSPIGYNIAWACLTPVEQEACEVYMLGRVLWCIFEAISAPQRTAVWLSYRWEPVTEFPEYTRTPEPMRRLIDRCTRGRQQLLSQLVVREKDQLVLRSLEGTGESTAAAVQTTARRWWEREIGKAEKWVAERRQGLGDGSWNENYYSRPTMAEVHDEILAYRKDLGFE